MVAKFAIVVAMISVDSGGQYLDGTTDVTRTFYYGDRPDREVIEMYTRVLMGAVDLARAIVPIKTEAGFLDLATRNHLFQIGQEREFNKFE
jgi:Xaa-Pro aminopeptidase